MSHLTTLKKLALAAVALLGAAGMADAKDVAVTATDHLSSLITAAEKETLTELVVTTGAVDKTNPSAGLTADDLAFLTSMPKLKYLDLRGASIALDPGSNYGRPYMWPETKGNKCIETLYMPNNLQNMGVWVESNVKEMYFPQTIPTGNLANKLNPNYSLEKVEFYQEGNVFKSIDGAVYTADGTQLIYYPQGKKEADVVLPEGMVSTINKIAMAFNPNIETITLPSTFRQLMFNGGREFGASAPNPERNENLRAIYVAEGNAGFTSIEGMLVDLSKKEIVACPPAFGVADLVIDGNIVKAINSSIFANNQTIRRVKFTEGVTTLGYSLFKGAANLAYVDIPSTVTNLGGECFAACSALETIICRGTTPPGFDTVDRTSQGVGIVMGNNQFRGKPVTAMVGVPAGAIDNYVNSYWNRNFTNGTNANQVDGYTPEQFAEYKTVNVVNGSTNQDVAIPGSSVNITADAPADNTMAFVRWESETPGVVFTNALSKTTSFKMPASDVTVTAVYDAKHEYTLVNAITPNGYAATGVTVNIEAPSRMNGADFLEWVVKKGDVTIANPKAVQTTFVMGNADVVIEATYAQVFMVNVIDGEASVNGDMILDAAPGVTVTITAAKKPGYLFASWKVNEGAVTLADAKAATTTFVMPESDVTVEATYTKDQSGIEGVAADGLNGAAEYFNLQGQKVENPSDGLYLMRSNGKTTKVIIK